MKNLHIIERYKDGGSLLLQDESNVVYWLDRSFSSETKGILFLNQPPEKQVAYGEFFIEEVGKITQILDLSQQISILLEFNEITSQKMKAIILQDYIAAAEYREREKALLPKVNWIKLQQKL